MTPWVGKRTCNQRPFLCRTWSAWALCRDQPTKLVLVSYLVQPLGFLSEPDNPAPVGSIPLYLELHIPSGYPDAAPQPDLSNINNAPYAPTVKDQAVAQLKAEVASIAPTTCISYPHLLYSATLGIASTACLCQLLSSVLHLRCCCARFSHGLHHLQTRDKCNELGM